jgi:hypothetical protein
LPIDEDRAAGILAAGPAIVRRDQAIDGGFDKRCFI